MALTIKAGRYKDGMGIAWDVVPNDGRPGADDRANFPWMSARPLPGMRSHRTWTATGRYSDQWPKPECDLIRRLPLPKPLRPKPKRKAGRARFEVVIRSPIMTTRAKASEIAARAQAVAMISHNCRVSVRLAKP